MADPTTIYVDADACPVKPEVYRVATRYKIEVLVVANQYMSVPTRGVRLVVVGDALDAADDWIAERAGNGDIVVTADVPLAARVIDNGALTISPRGHVHDPDTIGDALATRNLMTALREASPVDAIGGGPPPFTARDRQQFLQSLDALIHRVRRG